MANKKIKGIVVEIGGDTTKLGKALQENEKQTYALQNELKEVEKLLKFDPTNAELLAQKQELLTQAVAETTKKLDTLKEAEAQVIEQFEKGDIGEDQLRAFQREIIETESKLGGFERKLDDTADNIEDVGDAADNTEGGFTVMKGALADLVSNAIQGAISAIGDFIGSLMELSEATEEYRTMQAKLEGSSKSFGYSVDFANSKYQEFYKYLGDDQAATNAVTNLMGIGTSTESLSKLVDGAAGAWTAYGDSINVESLTEAISETIVCGKVTGSLADTINWTKDSSDNLKTALSGNKDAQKAYNDALKEGLPVEDAFNEALAKITDEQERADVVAQFLNTTYGESKKTYDELNSSITEANEAELALKDTQAQLGETLQPVNTAFTDLKNQALQAITPMVQALANAFMNTYNWLKEHPTALKIVTALIIALATAFGILATALAIQGIIKGVTTAFSLLNATIAANPIVLIISLIAALVSAFIYLWNNCEGFRQFFINMWNAIKKAVMTVVNAIVDFFKAAWEAIKAVWSAVTSFFSGIWNGIKNIFAGVKNFFVNVFTGAWNGIKNVFSKVGTFFGNLWNTIKDKFSAIGTAIADAISGAVKSGINGVISFIEKIINGAISLINGAIKLINLIPGVDIGLIKKVSLPRLAKGGIVDSPTIAEIGEDGREAVIPLEKNTGWMRELARQITDYQANNMGMAGGATLAKLDAIYERLDRMQIVLDSGTLVGETIDKIDAALATNQLLRARGV